MADDVKKERLLELRRPPMPFEQVKVAERQEVSPRMLRLRLGGDVLRRFDISQAAMSVRFVVPWPDEEELVIPTWNGNEFLRDDGSRPALRTFTPLDINVELGELTLEIVRHPYGAVSSWAEQSTAGAVAAISGVSAGYDFPTGAERIIVLGDETAIPAIRQLIDWAPPSVALDVHVEVVHKQAIIDFAERADGRVRVTWHLTPVDRPPGGELAARIASLDEIPGDACVWAAGEASAMQAIRNHLFKTLALPRARASVRGYWKLPR